MPALGITTVFNGCTGDALQGKAVGSWAREGVEALAADNADAVCCLRRATASLVSGVAGATASVGRGQDLPSDLTGLRSVDACIVGPSWPGF